MWKGQCRLCEDLPEHRDYRMCLLKVEMKDLRTQTATETPPKTEMMILYFPQSYVLHSMMRVATTIVLP